MIHLTRDGADRHHRAGPPRGEECASHRGWHALAAAARDVGDARAVILKSDVPGIFSAGADVREFETLADDPELRPIFRTAMRDAIEAVAALPMPVIAAIDGGCFGAAVALILACRYPRRRQSSPSSPPPPRGSAWAIRRKTSPGWRRRWGRAWPR